MVYIIFIRPTLSITLLISSYIDLDGIPILKINDITCFLNAIMMYISDIGKREFLL